MEIIAISNRKGGTGKTSVSVNLAVGLANKGKKVLLIDLDTQGHCALGVGIPNKSFKKFIHQIFIEDAVALTDVILPTAYKNLFIAAADQQFEHGSGNRDTGMLKAALADSSLRNTFDIVVIDTPPSLDYLLLNALHATNWVLVPYVPHQLSFEGVKQLIRVLFKVMSQGNERLKIMGFVPVMTNSRIRQHQIVNTNIQSRFGKMNVMPGIRNDIRLAESFAVGVPISKFDGNSRAAADFITLSNAVYNRIVDSEGNNACS